MKRIKSLMLLFAFVLLLTGSAWAGAFPTTSFDLSFDVASTDAISFINGKLSGDSLKPLSGEVKLSADKLSVDSGLSVITVKISPDNTGFSNYTISKDLSVDVYLVGSKDVFAKFNAAFSLSKDQNSRDMYVPFPIVLFDLGASGDVVGESSDKGDRVTKVTFNQVHSKDLDKAMTLKGLYVATANSGDIKVVTLSKDGYIEVKSTDKVVSSEPYIVVRNGATAKASMDLPVMLKVSADVSKDLMVTKWQWGSKLAYGILSKDAKGATSYDVVLEPMRMMSSTDVSSDVIKVSAYNVTKKAYSDTVQLRNYLMASDAVVNYHVGEKVISKDVKFADLATWVAAKLTSADFLAVSDDISADIGYILSGDEPAVTWYTSSDWKTSYDFSKNDIVVTKLDLYASYDKTATAEKGKDFDFTVTAKATPTSVKVGDKFTLEATLTSVDVTKVSADYVWTWTNATKTTAQALSLDKASGDVTAIADMVSSADFKVLVTVKSGDTTVSHDAHVTVTVSEAEEDEKATITIAPKSGTTATLPEGTVGTAYTATLSEYFTVTTSPDSKAAYTWSATGLPAGLSVSADAITGTPTASADAATVTVKVTLSDDTTVSANATATITIKAAGGGSGKPDVDNMSEEEIVKEAVKSDGTIDKTYVDALIDNVKESDGTVALSKLTSNTKLIAVFAASVNNANGKLDLSTLSLKSLSGIADILSAIATKSGKSTADMTLDLSKQDSNLTAIDNLNGVTLKAISAAKNTYVKTFDLTGAKIPTVNLNGATNLDTLTLASNDTIADLDIGDTAISDLNAAGCTNLSNLEAAPASGTGSLENLDITGCTNLTVLSVSNNQLLGIKSPGALKKRGFTFSAGGQRRPSSGITFKTGMNLLTDIVNKLTSVVFELARFTITGGTLDTTTGNITFTTVPSSFKYYYTPGFTYAADAASTSGWFVVAEDDPSTLSMDVTIGGTADTTTKEATLPSSSGGGCDAGFGFGALAALMAVFALKKRR